MDEQGLTDAAILLMSLGEDDASQVLRHLSPKEVQKIGETIAATRTVPRDRLDEVIARFAGATKGQSLFRSDTGDYVRGVLQRALGHDKAGMLIERILEPDALPGIENVKWMDPVAVAEMLRGEHPQIVAALVVHLDADQAADIVRLLPDAQRNEVLYRVATLESIQPAALDDLNEVLARLMGANAAPRAQLRGGTKPAADMINLLGSGNDSAVLESIRMQNEELAQQIMDLMFVFDDLMKLDDKSIQLLLKEVASETLIISLKGATPALREKFLGNMSSRAAEALREDLESRGAMRLTEVEAQQKEILKTLRRLADEGQVVLGGGGGGSVV
ncbi:MAG: flagellar motor switch protein FliG [Burkholderiaceae bacterium]|nr:flagellar motor switch protein FliG [Burkholderiales bacterium]MBP7568361.1 flagellar motor switch protein FliG [Burkholderiaceae bacterium]